MVPPHGHGSQHYPASSLKDHDWLNFFRLVSISAVATLATTFNIFTISSIIVDDLLRKKGNQSLIFIWSNVYVEVATFPNLSLLLQPFLSYAHSGLLDNNLYLLILLSHVMLLVRPKYVKINFVKVHF